MCLQIVEALRDRTGGAEIALRARTEHDAHRFLHGGSKLQRIIVEGLHRGLIGAPCEALGLLPGFEQLLHVLGRKTQQLSDFRGELGRVLGSERIVRQACAAGDQSNEIGSRSRRIGGDGRSATLDSGLPGPKGAGRPVEPAPPRDRRARRSPTPGGAGSGPARRAGSGAGGGFGAPCAHPASSGFGVESHCSGVPDGGAAPGRAGCRSTAQSRKSGLTGCRSRCAFNWRASIGGATSPAGSHRLS